MTDQFTRTRLLLGDDGIERLKKARVAVFGLGGVGSYVVEALARSGVGTLDIIDDDVIALSNLNRLLYATQENVGQPKTEVVKARIKAICPDTVVHACNCFYLPETAEEALVCLADKFFSKSGDMTEKPLAKIRKAMLKFGPASLERFDALCRRFKVTN